MTLYLYVPHSSHLSQPHDVDIFAALKHRFGCAVEDWMRYDINHSAKYDSLTIVRAIRSEVYPMRNIMGASSHTALYRSILSQLQIIVRTLTPEA